MKLLITILAVNALCGIVGFSRARRDASMADVGSKPWRPTRALIIWLTIGPTVFLIYFIITIPSRFINSQAKRGY